MKTQYAPIRRRIFPGVRRLLPWHLFVAWFLVGLPLVAGEFVFDENFDNDPPYADNRELPSSWTKGLHGNWQISLTPGRAAALTVPDQCVSAPRSLRLSVSDSSEPGAAGAGVIGVLSEDKLRSVALSDAITLKFAFRIENPSGQTRGKMGVSITGAFEGQIRQAAQIRFLENGSPLAEANFGGDWREIPGAEVEPEKWYWLEISMPRDPADTQSKYTVRISSDPEGKNLLGTASGPLASAMEGNTYGYFNIGNSVPGASLYVDDVIVMRAE